MNKLQNIKLPNFLMVDWYKSHLIQSENQPDNIKISEILSDNITQKDTTELAWFIGENKKNITIVIHQPEQAVIDENWKSFLTNVLKACNYTLQDTTIINIYQKTINYTQIKEQFKSQYLLLFDVEPALIGIPNTIPPYDIRVDEGCAIILSESISKMLPDTPEAKKIKMKLWTCLKKLFNVK